jgi:hypothetical protein
MATLLLATRVASTYPLDKVVDIRSSRSRQTSCHSISMQVRGEIIYKIHQVRHDKVSVSNIQRWMIIGPACKAEVIVQVWRQIHSHKCLRPKRICAALTNIKTKLAIIFYLLDQPLVVVHISSIISRNTNINHFSKISRTLKKRN